MKVRVAINKDKHHFNEVLQVIADITWDILNTFVSFRKCLATNRNKVHTFSCKKDELHFNDVIQVFAHIIKHIQKMIVSFRKCFDTDTSQTCPYTTPERQNLALTLLNRGTFGYKTG